MKIGELARHAGCGVETVRYYEREGLLTPPRRTASNYREYDDAHLRRLRFVRRCRALDMSHDEIRALLALQAEPAAACDGVNACVDAHIHHVETRISELRALLDELHGLRARCQAPDLVASCGILDALVTSDATVAAPASHLERPGASHRHR